MIKFELNSNVTVALTKQSGKVIGVAIYMNYPNSYWVEHVDGDGDVVRRWFDEDQLVG